MTLPPIYLLRTIKLIKVKHWNLLLISVPILLFSCKSTKNITQPATPAVTKPTTVEPISTPVKPEPFSAVQVKYAKILDVSPDKINNTKLYELIDKWWGAKYKTPPGKTPKEGVDCSGFAAIVYRDIYDKKIKGEANRIASKTSPLKQSELKEGDLVFFNRTKSSDSSNTISHVGIYLGNRKFVHASSSKGVIISSLDDEYYWKSRYVISGRLTEEVSTTSTTTSTAERNGNNNNSTPSTSTDSTSGSPMSATGKASYYADGFEGRLTASGEVFTNKGMTAASRKFKIGTKVKVTNLKNQNSVIVVINDKIGTHKRLIDLTKNAAQQLDMIRDGIATVKVEVIE